MKIKHPSPIAEGQSQRKKINSHRKARWKTSKQP